MSEKRDDPEHRLKELNEHLSIALENAHHILNNWERATQQLPKIIDDEMQRMRQELSHQLNDAAQIAGTQLRDMQGQLRSQAVAQVDREVTGIRESLSDMLAHIATLSADSSSVKVSLQEVVADTRNALTALKAVIKQGRGVDPCQTTQVSEPLPRSVAIPRGTATAQSDLGEGPNLRAPRYFTVPFVGVRVRRGVALAGLVVTIFLCVGVSRLGVWRVSENDDSSALPAPKPVVNQCQTFTCRLKESVNLACGKTLWLDSHWDETDRRMMLDALSACEVPPVRDSAVGWLSRALETGNGNGMPRDPITGPAPVQPSSASHKLEDPCGAILLEHGEISPAILVQKCVGIVCGAGKALRLDGKIRVGGPTENAIQKCQPEVASELVMAFKDLVRTKDLERGPGRRCSLPAARYAVTSDWLRTCYSEQ